jgi:hypothetical protein
MTTDATAGATQADATATTSAQAATITTATDPQAGKSLEDYEKMIADLRKENASHRIKLKAVEDAEAARQLAALSDAEKLQKRAEQAEKQIQTYKAELVTAQIQLQATTRGIANAELISPYVLGKLEYDDDGKPTNLDKVLDEVIKSNPNLVVNADSAAQTASTKTPPTTPPNNPGRSQIVAPGTLPQGQRISFEEMYAMKKRT